MRVPTNLADSTFLQCAWDILVAAYMLNEDTPFFLASKASTKTKGSLLKYAMSTHDKELGLKLGMAIEEVRGAAKIKRSEMGLCMTCFIHSTDSFIERNSQCKALGKHLDSTGL
ncbi:uncharacterized protein FTOL_02907 [Fusarium torulosum]|uniref:Uncharacterized protein n=1 Tax=Fusarium torulosum TaxID=33205 RepID=A0AAE8M3N9_9HYPO|nr:uncharacterized protein FTOL_02907 [Fusarium torulosum]